MSSYKVSKSNLKSGYYIIICEAIDQKNVKCLVKFDGESRADEFKKLYESFLGQLSNKIPVNQECILEFDELESYLTRLNRHNANVKARQRNKVLREKAINWLKNATPKSQISLRLTLTEYYTQTDMGFKHVTEVELSVENELIFQEREDNSNLPTESIDSEKTADNSLQIQDAEEQIEEKPNLAELIDLCESKIPEFQNRRYDLKNSVKGLENRANQLSKKLILLRQKSAILDIK